MPVNEQLADRLRETFQDIKHVEEKEMFSGVCFMVNGKMCVCVNETELMCRVGPEQYEEALEKPGCRAMIHGGRVMKGFVFVNEDAVRTKKEFDYWVNLALAFNEKAKASPKKKKKSTAKKQPPNVALPAKKVTAKKKSVAVPVKKSKPVAKRKRG